jgi:pimeloyl-ACP methyl ester carboxylesterase
MPKEYAAFVDQIGRMWFAEPNWTDAELAAIDTPVLVVDGDHNEAIKGTHTECIAATIPHAGLLILPNVSHFAFLQDPNLLSSQELAADESTKVRVWPPPTKRSPPQRALNVDSSGL